MSSMQETIINAFNFRHATKEFDPERKLVSQTSTQY